MKKLLIAVAVAGVVTLAISAGLLHNTKPRANTANISQNVSSNDIVSKTGIHWHPELAIYIKGQKQEIPANIGIGKQYANSKWYDPMMDMTDFHTHDNSGTLHWEVMEGPVTKDHVQLKAFFDVWGKTFNADQIFNSQNGANGKVSMTVNGQPNSDYQNYVVKDGDLVAVAHVPELDERGHRCTANDQKRGQRGNGRNPLRRQIISKLPRYP